MSSGHVDTTIKTAVLANTVFDAVLDATAINAWYTEVAAKIDGNYDEAHALFQYHSNMNQQALINGNFDIWQRGTSFTNPASGSYTADRWVLNYDGSGMSHLVSAQSFAVGQTTVPNNPTFFYRRQVNTAATGQTSHDVGQRIENVNNFAGMKITKSFWLKADAARTVGVFAEQNFGSGGSASVFTAVTNFNLSTSWQKFTVTFTLGSISGKTIGTSSFLGVYFRMPLNSTFFVDIAQDQVNVGDTALPFQPRSFAEELALCQRYYEKSYNYFTYAGVANLDVSLAAYARANTTARAFCTVAYKVIKRVNPTVRIFNYSGTVGKVSTVDTANSVGTTVTGADRSNEKGLGAIQDSGTGFTVGADYWFGWDADAEI